MPGTAGRMLQLSRGYRGAGAAVGRNPGKNGGRTEESGGCQGGHPMSHWRCLRRQRPCLSRGISPHLPRSPADAPVSPALLALVRVTPSPFFCFSFRVIVCVRSGFHSCQHRAAVPERPPARPAASTPGCPASPRTGASSWASRGRWCCGTTGDPPARPRGGWSAPAPGTRWRSCRERSRLGAAGRTGPRRVPRGWGGTGTCPDRVTGAQGSRTALLPPCYLPGTIMLARSRGSGSAWKLPVPTGLGSARTPRAAAPTCCSRPGSGAS